MIYVLEDDTQIRMMEEYALKTAGFEVRGFESGEEFLKACMECVPQLALLDVMLPGVDGLAVLRRLKGARQTEQIPIIMVTAKTTEMDIVAGLDTGADDYLVKPFGIMELLSRVRAVLRRMEGTRDEAAAREQCGMIVLKDKHRAVFREGQEVALTYKEYELLKLLMEHPEEVVSRERILNEVWGTNFEGESRTLDMHIRTLRQKLGQAGAQIETVRKVGYRLTAAPAENHHG